MPEFTAGVNVAMKVPRAHYDATVAFYRDTLGFDVEPLDGEGGEGGEGGGRSHWIRNPAGVIHLLAARDGSRESPSRRPDDHRRQ